MRHRSLKYDHPIVPTRRPHTDTRMRVPLLDLRLQYAPMGEEILSAVTRLCDSQQFIMGPIYPELTAGQQESVVAALSERAA